MTTPTTATAKIAAATAMLLHSVAIGPTETVRIRTRQRPSAATGSTSINTSHRRPLTTRAVATKTLIVATARIAAAAAAAVVERATVLARQIGVMAAALMIAAVVVVVAILMIVAIVMMESEQELAGGRTRRWEQ